MRTKSLQIGESFLLPFDAVTSTIVVYGGKGMGKTNFGRVLVEELTRAGLRWSYLDPLGVAWGLRHSADGKGPGIECIILGGVHGDIPIESTGGAVVADLVVDEPANVIIDFSRDASGQMWSIAQKIRFITDYAYRIFQRQGQLIDGHRREPFFQILDEAARYVPQTIPSGSIDLAKCVAAWEQLVEEGRNVGIGVGLLTQRSARMNKSVSELADAIFAFRTVGPRSIDAIMDWLGEHIPRDRVKSLVETVRSLDVGKCLVVSPGWLKFEGVVKIRLAQTFDSSATPRPGERGRRITGEAAKPDLAKYSERMKATIEKVKAEDPRELRRKIQELERQVLAKPAAAVDENAIKEALARRDREWTKVVGDITKTNRQKLLERIEELSVFARVGMLEPSQPDSQAFAAFASGGLVSGPQMAEIGRSMAHGNKAFNRILDDVNNQVRNPRYSPHAGAASSPNVSRPQLEILRALGEAEAIGREAISRSWLAFLAGVSSKSSGFEKNVSTLSSGGFISYPSSGLVALTDKGRDTAPRGEHYSKPLTTHEMLERISRMLSTPQADLLRILHKHHPLAISRGELAELAGVSALSSGFEKNVSTLSSRELVTYPAKGEVRAADWLFL